jgi:hypothetical protein
MTDHLCCPPSSTLASSLRQEWTARLRRQELHGLDEQPISAHKLLTRLQIVPGPARDRLWLSLLELDGLQRALAHRILLQAMLDKALRLARTCHGLQVLEDRAGRGGCGRDRHVGGHPHLPPRHGCARGLWATSR